MNADKLEARRIVDNLLRDLKSGDLKKIGIDEIREAIRVCGIAGTVGDDRFEELVTRELVSRV